VLIREDRLAAFIADPAPFLSPKQKRRDAPAEPAPLDLTDAPDRSAVPTAASRTKAIQFVADLLKQDEHLRKGDAENALAEAGIAVSATGFKHHVWPKARERAGLAKKAPPCPK